ncbi:ABC transporter substrate-binding protein [Yaniella halotolerans]|uniref:ABC transporter substrate-binding protein n=1 Tax=Yaniella halotolerans TaxID=225453 RepID=UPI0003B3C842|nr:ABC transporter substrate-binding protein [Yaniella halotolerans]
MKTNTLLKTSATAAALGLLLTACGSDEGGAEGNGDESYSVAIAQYVAHPSLDATAQGMKDVFEEADADIEVEEQNAQADQATMNNIVGTYGGDDNLDAVLPIATPVAIAAATSITETPIIFSAVTDPVDAGLVPDWETPGENITGVSDMNPVEDQLQLILDVVEDAEVIGIPYSSAESNSVVQVEAAKDAADVLGIEIEEVAVTNTSEVAQGVESFSDVDAIYVPTDNTVVSGLETVISYGIDNQVPVFAAESDSVERGTVGTYGLNYYEHGRQAGEMALSIITGEAEVADTPTALADDAAMEYTFNLDAAEQMGVEVPEDLSADANIVGEDEDAQEGEADEETSE